MPANDEPRELVRGIIATVVAVIGAFCVWSDLRSDAVDRGDGMITSAVVSRAGAIVVRSESSAQMAESPPVLD
jgi:hypothetical protein